MNYTDTEMLTYLLRATDIRSRITKTPITDRKDIQAFMMGDEVNQAVQDKRYDKARDYILEQGEHA